MTHAVGKYVQSLRKRDEYIFMNAPTMLEALPSKHCHLCDSRRDYCYTNAIEDVLRCKAALFLNVK